MPYQGLGPGFWVFPARHHASACPAHRPKWQCRCLLYPSCGDDTEGTAWIRGRRRPQLARVAVLQQRAAQPGACHLLDVLPGFGAELLGDHVEIYWIFKVVMERIVAEAQHLCCGHLFGRQRLAVIAMLREAAPPFRKFPSVLYGHGI